MNVRFYFYYSKYSWNKYETENWIIGSWYCQVMFLRIFAYFLLLRRRLFVAYIVPKWFDAKLDCMAIVVVVVVAVGVVVVVWTLDNNRFCWLWLEIVDEFEDVEPDDKRRFVNEHNDGDIDDEAEDNDDDDVVDCIVEWL